MAHLHGVTPQRSNAIFKLKVDQLLDNLFVKLLKLLIEGLGGDPCVIDAAYAKPLARGQLVYYPPIAETENYVNKVLRDYYDYR